MRKLCTLIRQWLTPISPPAPPALDDRSLQEIIARNKAKRALRTTVEKETHDEAS